MKVTKDRFTIITALIALVAFIALLVFADDTQAADTEWRCTDIQGGSVLDVGDSHTWLSGCGTAYPGWDVDADPGRRATRAAEVVREQLRPRHRVVVFDIATNNRSLPLELAAEVQRVYSDIRRRKLVLVTCQTATAVLVGTPSCAAPNAILREFAASHPRRVVLARWREQVDLHPEYLGPDGVHFTTAGYQARVALVKAAVNAAVALKARR